MSNNESKCLSCHIIGFNPYSKKSFVDKLNANKYKYNDIYCISLEPIKGVEEYEEEEEEDIFVDDEEEEEDDP